MSSSECPYGLDDCPQVRHLRSELIELRQEVTELRKTQLDMSRTLYIIFGVVAVTLGVDLGGIL